MIFSKILNIFKREEINNSLVKLNNYKPTTITIKLNKITQTKRKHKHIRIRKYKYDCDDVFEKFSLM